MVLAVRRELLTGGKTPVPCPAPCLTRSCLKWIDPHPIGKKSYEIDEKKVSSSSCNVYAVKSENGDNLTINLECQQQGTITLELYNLMGSLVYRAENSKKGYLLSFTINENLPLGIYFIRVKMEDNVLYYNKINIFK